MRQTRPKRWSGDVAGETIVVSVKGVSDMTVLRCVGYAVTRLRIARYRRHQLDREFADRHAQDHLERLRAGIKDNNFGLNGH